MKRGITIRHKSSIELKRSSDLTQTRRQEWLSKLNQPTPPLERRWQMKHFLLTTIAAVLVGCGESQQSVPAPETKPVAPVAESPQPEPPTTEAPDISIHDAAMLGNIEAVKQHIAAGTYVDSEVITGWTPLYFAAQGGYKEIVELLLTKGADVNAKTTTGTTPLDQASAFNHTEIVDLLRKHGGKYGTIYTAVGGGDIEAVKEFLTAGADVNAKDDGGNTPLDLANPFRLKSTELADLLRKHGGKTKSEL